ncbi:retrovirus-related pol polyprotein from transposon TNT 1-94 [Tanacetum coccineum]
MDGKPMEINMLVEKKYPLIKELLEKMLNLQLEAEEESTMAFELIKFIKSLLEEYDKLEAGTTSITLTARLPILNLEEYDLWLMRIEQYFLMTDYSLWEVILNGNKVLKRTVRETEQEYEPTIVEKKQDRKNEMKARGTLLMALPNKDQLKFHSYKDAKLLMEAIEKRLQKHISQLEIQDRRLSISEEALGAFGKSQTYSAEDRYKGRGYDRGQEAEQKQVEIMKDRRDKVQAEYHAARDSDDALVCCVENTVEDRIMDSGASFHATYCKEELERFKLRSGKVRLADDKTLDIAGVGDVVLKTSFGTSWTLKDVRYIPSLKRRLISVGQLDEEGYHVGFGDQQWKVTKGSLVVALEQTCVTPETWWFGEAEESFFYNISEDKETTEDLRIVMLKMVPETPLQFGVAERLSQTFRAESTGFRVEVSEGCFDMAEFNKPNVDTLYRKTPSRVWLVQRVLYVRRYRKVRAVALLKGRATTSSCFRSSSGQQVAPELLAASITAWVKGSKEIVGLMLMTMKPEIQRNLENLHANDMLKELKTLFAQQAE